MANIPRVYASSRKRQPVERRERLVQQIGCKKQTKQKTTNRKMERSFFCSSNPPTFSFYPLSRVFFCFAFSLTIVSFSLLPPVQTGRSRMLPEFRTDQRTGDTIFRRCLGTCLPSSGNGLSGMDIEMPVQNYLPAENTSSSSS